jgi:hypothetical protein
MNDEPRASAVPVEPYFDRTPQPFGDGLPVPVIYDASPRALRQRTVNFAAKRLVDMRYVSGLDRATAERHLRWRPVVAPGGLAFRDAPASQAELAAAHKAGDIVIDMNDADRRVTVRWNDAKFGEPVIDVAVHRAGHGGDERALRRLERIGGVLVDGAVLEADRHPTVAVRDREAEPRAHAQQVVERDQMMDRAGVAPQRRRRRIVD